MIDNPREYEVMAAVEAKHWWYRTLHAQVLEALASHPGQTTIKILDAGCGTGGLLVMLARQGYVHTQGFDLSPVAVKLCQAQGLQVMQGDLALQLFEYASSSFDVIISNDTFYHLRPEQRVTFLREAYRCLQPNGRLIMNLPALAAFRGQHDRAVGVTHRFSRAEFLGLVAQTPFTSLTLRYWPVCLAPLIWGVRTWQRYTDKRNSDTLPASDLKSSGGWLRGMLNGALYRLLQLERVCLKKGPVGSSLFAVLQRPPDS